MVQWILVDRTITIRELLVVLKDKYRTSHNLAWP
jgi:hypothetical protein